MAEKEAESRREREINLDNTRRRLDELHDAAERGEEEAMQRSIHLASAAGKMAARLGKYDYARFDDSSQYYNYSSALIGRSIGAGYGGDKVLMERLAGKAKRMHDVYELRRKKAAELARAAEEVPVGKYETAHAMAIIVALFAGSIALMTLTATGRVVGYGVQKSSSLLGICLFAICVIATYVVLFRKKK